MPGTTHLLLVLIHQPALQWDIEGTSPQNCYNIPVALLLRYTSIHNIHTSLTSSMVRPNVCHVQYRRDLAYVKIE